MTRRELLGIAISHAVGILKASRRNTSGYASEMLWVIYHWNGVHYMPVGVTDHLTPDMCFRSFGQLPSQEVCGPTTWPVAWDTQIAVAQRPWRDLQEQQDFFIRHYAVRRTNE